MYIHFSGVVDCFFKKFQKKISFELLISRQCKIAYVDNICMFWVLPLCDRIMSVP